MQVYAHEIPERYEFRDLSGVYGPRFFHAFFETGGRCSTSTGCIC